MGLVGNIKQEATSSLKEGEPSSAFKADKIAHQQTLDCYCPTVTVRSLLKFLTISRVIELHFKGDGSHWKSNTRGSKFSEGKMGKVAKGEKQK
jgi:hypothetical protein